MNYLNNLGKQKNIYTLIEFMFIIFPHFLKAQMFMRLTFKLSKLPKIVMKLNITLFAAPNVDFLTSTCDVKLLEGDFIRCSYIVRR